MSVTNVLTQVRLLAAAGCGAAMVALSLPGSVAAADLSYKDSPVSSYYWTGFYAGANVGYSWSFDDTRSTVSQASTGVAQSVASTGVIGGGQIGYNFQQGNLVYGLEADLQGAATSGDDIASSDPFYAKGKNSLDWFGTLRGRFGAATSDRTLFFATGGLAFGGIKNTLTESDAATTGSLTKDSTKTGFVVGGGVEQAISPKWSMKFEYDYLNFGKEKLSLNGGNDTFTADQSYSLFRVGLNYHTSPEYIPLK
jgi:outer membrane immunogenic protein